MYIHTYIYIYICKYSGLSINIPEITQIMRFQVEKRGRSERSFPSVDYQFANPKLKSHM